MPQWDCFLWEQRKCSRLENVISWMSPKTTVTPTGQVKSLNCKWLGARWRKEERELCQSLSDCLSSFFRRKAPSWWTIINVIISSCRLDICRETRVKIIHLNCKAFKISAKSDTIVVHNVPERQENSELLKNDSLTTGGMLLNVCNVLNIAAVLSECVTSSRLSPIRFFSWVTRL